MLPKRHPDDRRNLPTSHPLSTRQPAPLRCDGRRNGHATIRQRNTEALNFMVDNALPLDTSRKGSRPEGRTPEQVRIRSRDVYNALLDLIEAKINSGNELSASEIAQLAGVTGRIGVPAQLDAKVTAQPLLSNDERNAMLANILADLASRSTLGEGTARQLIASQSDAAEPPVDASVDVSEDS